MPLLPPIELIPDSDLPRRVTKKRRLASPDRPSLERPFRKHCTECKHMLPNLPFRSVIRPYPQHRSHQHSLDTPSPPIITIRPPNLCDTASIQDPVTPPRRPVPLEDDLDYQLDDDDKDQDDQQKRLARNQLPWLYQKSKFLSATATHSRTLSPCSSTDSLPLITPGSSYQSSSIPASIVDTSTPRSIFGSSPDTSMAWAHHDPTPIWADAWEDDMDVADNRSDLALWDYASSSPTFDPLPLDVPTPSSSTTTARTPRTRSRQNRQSTRSYQPYWSASRGRANHHPRPTTTRSAALETAQSTLPSWMCSSTANRPSWRHALIDTYSSPNETNKDQSPPRPTTPPMKFSTSSFHLSALKLR